MADAISKGALTNTDILAIAVWEAGGGEHFIDIEDAYSVCWKVAPHRFSWRTRKDLPNTAVLSKALRDLTRRVDQPVVKRGFYKIRLSASGLDWINTHESEISALMGSNSEKIVFSSNQASRQLTRFKKTGFFGKWRVDCQLSMEKWEMGAALRCSLTSSPEIWLKRIDTLKADAQYFNDQDVLAFLDTVVEEYPAWFGRD